MEDFAEAGAHRFSTDARNEPSATLGPVQDLTYETSAFQGMSRPRLRIDFGVSVTVVVFSFVAMAFAAFSVYTRWWQYCLQTFVLAVFGQRAWRLASALWPAKR